MRVAGGNEKGRRLKGAVTSKTRATTERVRAAIFNILDPNQYLNGRVLDLFSGTGSLGIEALSHGAGWADFVEWDRRQSSVISSNLESTGFSAQSSVHRLDVFSALESLPGKYDLVMMDPPYKMGDLDNLMATVAAQLGLIVDGGVVIAGHSKREELKKFYGRLRLTSHRQYGDNVVDFYVYEENSTNPLAQEEMSTTNSEITDQPTKGSSYDQDGTS